MPAYAGSRARTIRSLLISPALARAGGWGEQAACRYGERVCPLLAGQGGWQLWDGGAGGSQNATITAASCYPDCNNDGNLTVQDFGCFQTAFVTGNMYADCNQSGTLTVQDFGCFQTAFVAGCP